MADEKTWQDKLDKGEPLNSLEETKADADFNVKQRLKEQQERDEFETRKSRTRSTESNPPREENTTDQAQPASTRSTEGAKPAETKATKEGK